MTTIQNHPRFKKDKDRYINAIEEINDRALKSELKSLYDQYIMLIKQIDQNFDLLISERLANKTQSDDLQTKLQSIRAKLEQKIPKY